MAHERHVLTDAIQRTICAFVSAGGFAHVAAEAAGVPKEVFDAWMKRGDPKRTKQRERRYRLFHEAVKQAEAQARLSAEVEAIKRDPIRWLMQGPGKDREDYPGWSQVPKPIINQTNQTLNVMLDPMMTSLFARVLQVLAPFPAARAAVAQALAGAGQPLSRPTAQEAIEVKKAGEENTTAPEAR
jgi:hypothetical protein